MLYHKSFIMQKIKRLAVVLLFIPIAFFSCNINTNKNDSELKKQIGQMLIIGFRGAELTPDNHIINDIKQLNIGGVILFDYDSPSKEFNRNIRNPQQLKQLIADLKDLTSNKLIISIDQEGGMVNRLKPKYGFPFSVSVQYLGNLNNEDSTRYYAGLTAKTLFDLGINVNFAPCVDLNVNTECPIIGLKERSFSGNPLIVMTNAFLWLEEQELGGVIGCLKHFPGHGSSTTDTHLGIADITSTWTEDELIPYRELIKTEKVDMIMTSHIYNAKLDEKYPATMSKTILTGILREELEYNGIIITDDLAMGAMVDNYSLEEILEKSINAGADLLCLSNNGKEYDPEIARKAVDIIFNLVKTGKIKQEKINIAYNRIMKLKEKIR